MMTKFNGTHTLRYDWLIEQLKSLKKIKKNYFKMVLRKGLTPFQERSIMKRKTFAKLQQRRRMLAFLAAMLIVNCRIQKNQIKSHSAAIHRERYICYFYIYYTLITLYR